MTDKDIAATQSEFERALGEIRTRVSLSGSAAQKIAIAYSGGLDSAALLYLLRAYATQHGLELFAFHVHHGLSLNADQWLAHCQQQCAGLGVAFDARRVQIANQDKSGVEEAARHSRYAALGEMCRAHDVPLLLTAHHQDDQAETVLLQLLRGSGVAGLSGMDSVNHAADLLGDATLLMGRPLLQLARADLEKIVTSNAIAFVEDESNLDPRYARNALRHQVMPTLAQHFPGFQQRFARTAQHAQSAQRLLIELAAQDLTVCLDGDCLDITKLRQFSTDRIDSMLRYWFGSRGVRMPSTSWLNEMRTQLLEAKHDAQLCVTHADCHIRRHRDRVYLTPKLDPASLEQAPLAFRWDGTTAMQFAEFGGTLFFEEAEQGVSAEWLRGQALTMQLRSGGERLKPAWNRPTKSLKYHYQAGDVPAWERERLPLVFAEKQLLFAAGIGMDCHSFSTQAGTHIQLRWQFDSP
ncbi:putative tRNA(Ile)-lysidine synthase (tRNA(Ile)-lysidine synthetase) (tRNA(Ile)-2-lysyl-cytidine synthase) TilS [Herminiimonas arsenicoxydans]|uniref:tRNA(Ile)-lysidine synthase n=1 Tax=Herminiimonas arsenicoxydans TaxID=204773 RepID=A4G4M5_HERAR|nr:putative tRNA(Ile)-lysidine synthase (tRNA(Ile)-lysidine synthetase) (tRNA(Ile)-2-lysyl-cytidine synthase) TilS [Herminiimonas arsenicoxydans]